MLLFSCLHQCLRSIGTTRRTSGEVNWHGGSSNASSNTDRSKGWRRSVTALRLCIESWIGVTVRHVDTIFINDVRRNHSSTAPPQLLSAMASTHLSTLRILLRRFFILTNINLLTQGKAKPMSTEGRGNRAQGERKRGNAHNWPWLRMCCSL